MKKRFGAEIVKKIMFNDQTSTPETLDDIDDRIMETRNPDKYPKCKIYFFVFVIIGRFLDNGKDFYLINTPTIIRPRIFLIISLEYGQYYNVMKKSSLAV